MSPKSHDDLTLRACINNTDGRRTEFFRSRDGAVFADLHNDGIRETWPVQSETFSRWLARRHFEVSNEVTVPGRLKAAIKQIEAEAQVDCPERQVFRRVGKCDGRVYFDLADEKWSAVEIDATGWRVVRNPPIRFVRTPGMLALPVPDKGGSVEALRSLLNLGADHDFVLIVAWLLGTLHSGIAKPILAIRGGEGSAKSTLVEIVRGLVDPHDPPYTGMPGTEPKLKSAAAEAYCLAFDNVSGLTRTMSDALCRLVTGGSNQPVIINGISDVVASADLADRCIFIDCAPICDADRRTHSDVMAAFAKLRPAVLGALLDAVAEGLRKQATMGPDGLPRMADFAHTAASCETAFWPVGTFIAAYNANRAEIVDTFIDANPVASAVRSLAGKRRFWEGQAGKLDAVLRAITGNLAGKNWPANERILANALRELAPSLMKLGIHVEFHKSPDRARTRLITITARTQDAANNKEPISSSAASAPANSGNQQPEDRNADADGQANAMPDASTCAPIETARTGALDAADAPDAENVDDGDNPSKSPTAGSPTGKDFPAAPKGTVFMGSREVEGKMVSVFQKLTHAKPKKPHRPWRSLIQRAQHKK